MNWNGKQLLEQFLPSVVQHSQNADIYVADNASTDDSLAYLEQHFPQVQIIKNPINGGYAKGYNDALKQIDAEIYCLLNSDVQVTKDWLLPIVKVFESESNTVIIQPKILDHKTPMYFEYAGAGGGFIDKYGYPYCRGRIFNTIEKDQGQYNDTTEIFWASGACLFIRKSTFEDLNGFDESFFAHYEEIDLCWRAFNKGYVSKYVGSATVYHVGGATLNASNPKKTYLNFRNSLFSIVKNAHGFLFGLLLIRLILDGLASFKFLLSLKITHILAILRAHLSFYANLLNLLKQRKQLPQKKNYYKTRSIVWAYYFKKRRHH